jgi:3-oxoadipate enol-lactonase
MQKALINDVELEYESTGSGEAVLFISPVLADGFVPLATDDALGDYRIIRYHKRGWVGSTHTDGPVSIQDHAADAAALLSHLGVTRAHVVGHSSGAAVAAQLAVDDPDLVHTVALLELTLLSVPSGAEFLAAAAPVFDLYAAGEHEAAIAAFLSAASGLEWNDCSATLEQHAPGVVAQAVTDADTFFGVELPGLVEWQFGRDDAARVTQPVLSIVGSDTGPVWVEVAAFLRSSMPDVDEQRIEGVGHFLHLQEPAPVARAIADFLARYPIPSRSASRAGVSR